MFTDSAGPLRDVRDEVATTHWLGHRRRHGGARDGGNASDAAVAAGFVLHVVEPHLNGPAARSPILVTRRRPARCRVLCGQGVAPAGARRSRDSGARPDLVPGTGPLAATVPGAFGAWTRPAADARHLPLRRRARAAIGYAERRPPAPCRGSARPSDGRASCSATSGPRRPRYLPAAGAGGRASGSATRRWPRPTGGCSPRRRRPADREAQIEAARRAWYAGSSPRRSTRSAPARRSWTLAERATPACSPATTWPAGGDRGAAGRRSTTRG